MSGIREQQSSPQKRHSFNLKNSTFIILSSCYMMSLTKLLDEVSTFEEYMSIIYIVLSSFILIICYLIIVCTSPELFGLADNFEKIIANSKWLSTTQNLYEIFSQKSIPRNCIAPGTAAAVHWNQSTYWKMDQNSTFHRGRDVSAYVHFPTMACWFLCLFHHRFGKRCIWISISDMVM